MIASLILWIPLGQYIDSGSQELQVLTLRRHPPADARGIPPSFKNPELARRQLEGKRRAQRLAREYAGRNNG